MLFLEVVKIVLFLFGVPVMLLIQLLSKAIEWLAQFKDELPQINIVPTGTSPSFTTPSVQVPNGTGVPGQDKPVAEATDPVLLWGLLVSVFLLIAAVLLYRSFQKRRNSGDVGKIRLSVIDPPKKKRSPILSNRYKVRQLWCEFLRMENGWGLKLKKNDTSADVLRRIHSETDKESAAALRQIYLAARYDDRQSISRGQVHAAKQALKGTRKGKK